MPDDDSLMGLNLELDDEPDESFDPEIDDEIEDDDDALDDDDDLDDEDDEEEETPERAAKRTPVGESELEDEVDPDNLEADLNTILRDRIAASDDADDEDTAEADPGQPAEALGTVTPRRDDEWLCEGCFLLVSKSQLGSRNDPRCPSGEEICPSLDRLGP
jgi:hypothetical protein